MNVTREVVLDLLPLYLAGEASPATRVLVEEYLQQDPELARQIRDQWVENFSRIAPSSLPPELELRSLRRARRLVGLQRWLFALGLSLSLTALSGKFSFHGWHLYEAKLLLRDYPAMLGMLLGLGLACLAAYYILRRRLR